VSKDRAIRRAARLLDAEQKRATRAAVASRRQKRKDITHKLVPKLPDRRTGRLLPRRTAAQRAAIVMLSLLGLMVVWYLVDDLVMRLIIVLVLILALPALIVIALGRRNS
jgi:Flp pilus assembly protein TadB